MKMLPKASATSHTVIYISTMFCALALPLPFGLGAGNLPSGIVGRENSRNGEALS